MIIRAHLNRKVTLSTQDDVLTIEKRPSNLNQAKYERNVGNRINGCRVEKRAKFDVNFDVGDNSGIEAKCG